MQAKHAIISSPSSQMRSNSILADSFAPLSCTNPLSSSAGIAEAVIES
jgi:hypothetical protein